MISSTTTGYDDTHHILSSEDFTYILETMNEIKIQLRENFSSYDFDERINWQKNTFLDNYTASFSLVSGNELDDVLNLLVNDDRSCAILSKTSDLSKSKLTNITEYMHDKGIIFTEKEHYVLFSKTPEAHAELENAISLDYGEEKWRTFGRLFGYEQEKIDYFVSHMIQGTSPIQARIQEEFDALCSEHGRILPIEVFVEHQKEQWLKGYHLNHEPVSIYPTCIIEPNVQHEGCVQSCPVQTRTP